MNAGHSKSKSWFDESVKSSEDAWQRGLSNGLATPNGQGKRVIVMHAGGENGFVDGAMTVFVPGTKVESSDDYHEDCNQRVFLEFFERVVDNLPFGSCIIIDNAS